jgi:hypothetical protein
LNSLGRGFSVEGVKGCEVVESTLQDLKLEFMVNNLELREMVRGLRLGV